MYTQYTHTQAATSKCCDIHTNTQLAHTRNAICFAHKYSTRFWYVAICFVHVRGKVRSGIFVCDFVCYISLERTLFKFSSRFAIETQKSTWKNGRKGGTTHRFQWKFGLMQKTKTKPKTQQIKRMFKIDVQRACVHVKWLCLWSRFWIERTLKREIIP